MPISTIGSNSLNQTSDLTINGVTVGKGGGAVTQNTVVGASAGSANTTGKITAVGYLAARFNTTGSGNTALGGNDAAQDGALYYNTTGNYNIAVGTGSVASNTTGSSNTGIGYSALQNNTTGGNNTAVGYQAGYTGNGAYFQYSTLIGYQAGYTSSPSSASSYGNTCIGAKSGYSLTTGYGNILVGGIGSGGSDPTGFALTTGINNTFIGPSSGNSITTGSKNTIIGTYSGNQGGLDIRTASNNIVLSDGDGNPRLYCNSNGRWSMNGGTSALTPVLQIYSTIQDADVQMGSTQNGNDIHLYLVNSTRTSMLSQVSNNLIPQCGSNGVYLSNGATSWAAYSDLRLKDVTGTYTNALADVAKLEPIKFTWKSDSDKKPCVGLIAQSVEKVVPEAIDKVKKSDYKETGDETEYLSVRYSELIPLLTASIQELKTIVDAQAVEIAALKTRLTP